MDSNYRFIFGIFTSFFLFGNSLCQISQCPDPVELAPYCSCDSDSGSILYMDCSNVETEDQLENIFTTATFPTNKFYEFTIYPNRNLKNLTRNVFGDVTFKNIYLSNTVIEYIDESVFLNSISTLQTWNVQYANLQCQGCEPFPFSSIISYTKLTSLIIEYSGMFDVFPNISSTSLLTLIIGQCGLQLLPNGSFDYLPTVTYLSLFGNNFTTLIPGMFDNNPVLQTLNLGYNKINRIQAGTFRNLESLEVLYLQSNNISEIETATFKDLRRLTDLNLSHNPLQYFPLDGSEPLALLKNFDIGYTSITSLESRFLKTCPRMTTFNANSANIASIEPDTFIAMPWGHLRLDQNNLTTLDENWLRSPLVNEVAVNLSGNPLACGCDVAWLVLEPSLMIQLQARCKNLTSIQNLNPSYYANNC